MRIFGKDVLVVLADKRDDERLEAAAVRLFPGKYESNKISDVPLEKMRLRGASTQAATDRTREQLNVPRCPSCWRLLVRKTFFEYGRYCSVCGTKDNLTVHHIIPSKEHGSSEAWNLMPLCESCHNFIECHASSPRTREDCIRTGCLRIDGAN